MRRPATQLARERAARGLTQRAFAERLGLSPSTLSAVENGHSATWPRLRADAARLLGISERELFPEPERVAWRAAAVTNAYAPGAWIFRVVPLNAAARPLTPDHDLDEASFVTWLYGLRGREAPPELLARLREFGELRVA